MIVESFDDVDEDEAPPLAVAGIATAIVDLVDAALTEVLATPGLSAVLHENEDDSFVILV